MLSKTTILSDIVILTERSVGRISRRDFARDVSEIAFPFGQRTRFFTAFRMTKRKLGQLLYYLQNN